MSVVLKCNPEIKICLRFSWIKWCVVGRGVKVILIHWDNTYAHKVWDTQFVNRTFCHIPQSSAHLHGLNSLRSFSKGCNFRIWNLQLPFMNAYLIWVVVSLRSKLETILDQFVLGIRSNCTHRALGHPFLICCNP